MRPLLLLITCFAVHAAVVVAADEPHRPSGERSDVVLTLLHTNDMHCRVCVEAEGGEPVKPAGLSKLATLIDEVRRQMPHVLLFDAGDTISGQPEFHVSGGEGMVAAMNAIGFDAMAVGNHEFDRGHEIGARTLGKADFAVLTANVVNQETGEVWAAAEPYAVFEEGGVRVGVFGLTTPNTLLYEYPRSMGGHDVTDPIAAAKEMVRVLREQEDVDVVVALSHWGYRDDRSLAEQVDGIDIILGGHSHTTLEEQVWLNDTLIMQTGAHSKALGRADLWMRPGDDGFQIASVNGKDGHWWGHGDNAEPPSEALSGRDVDFPAQVLLRPDASTPDHPGVMAAYRPYYERTQAYLAEALADLKEPISGEGAKERETALGNLMADAIRAQMDADVAVMASSQFNPIVLEPGTVTMRDLYRLMGAYTRQHLVSVDAPGEHVRAMLTSVVAKEDARPLHVSGARVSPGSVTLEGGAPLEDDKVYRVAGAAHVMQDHLIGKPGVEIIYDDPTGATCRDALAAYLREQGTVTPPATDRTRSTVNEAARAGVSP